MSTDSTQSTSRRQQITTGIKERQAKLTDALINIRRAFGLVWQAHPPSALAMAGSTLVGSLLPAGQAWVGKLIVDAVVNSINAHASAQAGLQAVLPLLAAEFVLLVVQATNGQARTLAEHVLHARIVLTINTRIIRKALELDLAHFENAAFYDKMQNARREADWRSLQIVNGGFYVIQNIITLLSFAALLLRFSPWLAIVLFLATIPAFIAQSRYAELNFRVLSWRAPEFRLLTYLEQILTDYDAVKEVKLFGLGEPLLGRYANLFWKFLREDQDIAQKRSLASLGWGLLATVTYYGAYAWIVWKAVGGLITLGDMTLYLGIFRGSQSMFEAVLQGLSELYENGLFMSNLFAFLELKTQMSTASEPVPAPKAIRQGIEFRGVSFRYEGHEDWALRDVNLVIGPREKIALVGPNGRRQDDADQAADAAVRPDRGPNSAGRRGPARLRPGGAAPTHWRHLSRLRALSPGGLGERGLWADRSTDGRGADRGGGAQERGRRGDTGATGRLCHHTGPLVRPGARALGRRVAEGGAGAGVYARL